MKWQNKGHELDRIGRLLANVKTVYLYGINGNAWEILYVLNHAEEWIKWKICLVDRNINLQKNGYAGMTILSPEAFYAEDKENYIVVACPEGPVGKEIYDSVIVHGISEERVFLGWDFLYTDLSIYFLYAKQMVFFASESILPSCVCNLNCRDCLNFTPYIKNPMIYGIDEMKEDVDCFFNAVDLIYRFQITGGEPLLYPNLKELITYIDYKYRSKIMRLETVTNGTVVPEDELCEFIADHHVFVFLDDYTMSLSGEKKNNRVIVENKFKKYNVEYSDNYVEKWFQIYFPDTHRTNEKELVELFNCCGNPWSSIERGRISACNYSLYAQKAGIVEDDETDFYDLKKYESAKKTELVEFRLRYNQKGYVSFCKKCSGFALINSNLCQPAIQVERGAT